MDNAVTTRNVLLVLFVGFVATAVRVDGERTNECPFEVCPPEEATVLLQFSWEIPGLQQKTQESFYLKPHDIKPQSKPAPGVISSAVAGKFALGSGPSGSSTIDIGLKEISREHIVVWIAYSHLPPRTAPGYDDETMRRIRTQEAIVLPYADVQETSQGRIRYHAKWWVNAQPNAPANGATPRR